MSTNKLSINKACVFFGVIFLLISAITTLFLYRLTNSFAVALWFLLFCTFTLVCMVCFVRLIRRKLALFSDHICKTMDEMLSGNIDPPQVPEEESLFYKINYRLGRLYDAMKENGNSIAKERENLQELISDISHQVKTPIANLKMINSTLFEQDVPTQKRQDFLSAQAGQLDKLDFLMQAMIKTSRLETGVISLNKKNQSIYETLAIALGGILLSAEKKRIDVQVDCPEQLSVSHDRRWTSEALFNILDNAVKYTHDGGKIHVQAVPLERYLKIEISDTGIGIAEQHQGAIFKRFYREENVHDVEGIGVGLYLAREIITLQDGYIKVSSNVGKGSTFSVFLLFE